MLTRAARAGDEETRSDARVIGANFGLAAVMESAVRAAAGSEPVLVLGEAGAGKERIARWIHGASERAAHPFVKADCRAVAGEAELSALARSAGEGTLLLDEISELPAEAQAALIELIERVAAARLMATTRLNLDGRENAERENAERLRPELSFCFRSAWISIPPLRERRADIPALVEHFLDEASRELRLDGPPRLAAGAVDALIGYRWPGNVRELKNVMERALILEGRGPLRFEGLLPGAARLIGRGEFNLDRVIAEHIRRVLEFTRGKVHGPAGAAKLLGVNPSTLRNRMNKLGLVYGRAARQGRPPAPAKKWPKRQENPKSLVSKTGGAEFHTRESIRRILFNA